MEFQGVYYGKKYRLEETPIASGGEGTIFAIKGEPDKLAKVYHHPERAEQDKLRYMVLERQGVYGKFISRMIAWPLDVLIGDLGQIYGFTMPRFPGIKKLSEILPDHDIDWGERVVMAWNLCEIVQDVEKMNQCIGDMNPSNFGVDPESGHVYAFDADSFHFRASTGRLYPCYVGIAEYYAPELQQQITRGQDMRTLNPEHTFSRETDRFALAVLIFQLLFNGYHPFSARRLEQYGSSTVVHRQATNILNKVCAYFNPQVGTGIPKDAPPIDIVSPKMQQMFKRAFLTEDRPSATEWQGVLTELSGSLKTCSKQHHYYSGLSECPWCKGTDGEIPKSGGSVTGTGVDPSKYHVIEHRRIKKGNIIYANKKTIGFYDGSTPEKAIPIKASVDEAERERIIHTVKGEILVPGGLDINEIMYLQNKFGQHLYVQQSIIIIPNVLKVLVFLVYILCISFWLIYDEYAIDISILSIGVSGDSRFLVNCIIELGILGISVPIIGWIKCYLYRRKVGIIKK